MLKKLLLAFGLLFPTSAFAAQATGVHELGTLQVDGSSAGATSIVSPATTTNHTVTLPADKCTSGQAWTDNGSGVMACATISATSKAPFSGNCGVLGTATGTQYCTPNGHDSPNSSAPNSKALIQAGTITNLYVSLGSAPGTTSVRTFTVFEGPAGSEVATAATCVIATAATTCNITGLTVATNVGDVFYLVDVTTIATAAAATASFTIGFNPT